MKFSSARFLHSETLSMKLSDYFIIVHTAHSIVSSPTSPDPPNLARNLPASTPNHPQLYLVKNSCGYFRTSVSLQSFCLLSAQLHLTLGEPTASSNCTPSANTATRSTVNFPSRRMIMAFWKERKKRLSFYRIKFEKDAFCASEIIWLACWILNSLARFARRISKMCEMSIKNIRFWNSNQKKIVCLFVLSIAGAFRQSGSLARFRVRKSTE